MQLGCVPAAIAFCYRQYLITGIGKANKCLVNFLAKVYPYYQLTSYSQGWHDALIVLHPDLKGNRILEDAHSERRQVGGLLREDR
jgi:hypothetical protein